MVVFKFSVLRGSYYHVDHSSLTYKAITSNLIFGKLYDIYLSLENSTITWWFHWNIKLWCISVNYRPCCSIHLGTVSEDWEFIICNVTVILCIDYRPDHNVAVPQMSSIRLLLIVMFQIVEYITLTCDVLLHCTICFDFLESCHQNIIQVRIGNSTSEESSDQIPGLTVVAKCETLTPKRPPWTNGMSSGTS